MKKTIFGFVCAILMGCAFASCNNAANGETSAKDSTEVVADSLSVENSASVEASVEASTEASVSTDSVA